ncbi:ABC transporter permease [Desulfovibrio sp. OttesenSCG-928-C06]|nr:ABC transporter permease [Desulfovibrio sp. OttesenSCG-928-C06]
MDGFLPYLLIIIPALAAAVSTGTSILYATLGELVMERAGVLNLGVEGMMMVGCLASFLGCYHTGSPWFGLLCGGVAAMGMSAIHGAVCLFFQGSQVVSGLALTLFGVGVANYLGTPYIQQKVVGFASFNVPVLSSIPVLGPIFFQHDAMVYLSFFIPPLLWFLFMRTRYGLALRSTGENPEAVRAAGISPSAVRWSALMLGGFLVGMGGAYLALASMRMWVDNLVSGRGWIAVALVIFAFWRPGRAVFGVYLFTGVTAYLFRVQALGVGIPSSFLNMLPYLMTLAVLFASSLKGRGSGAPADLGNNLKPGS